MKKRIFALITALILLCCIYIILSGFLSDSHKHGSIRICVLDGFGKFPIENAKVVIPETGDELYTNADGLTEKVNVPVLRDIHYDGILRQNYGRITVLVYAQGYVPYGIFFVQIESDTDRLINAWVFENDGIEEQDPFVIIESPDTEWANELIRSYQ